MPIYTDCVAIACYPVLSFLFKLRFLNMAEHTSRLVIRKDLDQFILCPWRMNNLAVLIRITRRYTIWIGFDARSIFVVVSVEVKENAVNTLRIRIWSENPAPC